MLDQGTDTQRKALLPLFCGERFHAAALAWIEPGPAFEPPLARTPRRAEGQGIRPPGAKSFVPPRTARATPRDRAQQRGLDAFVVPRDAAGLRISEPEKQLGLRALPTAALELERVELPAEARLGGDAGCDVPDCSTTRAPRSPPR